MLAPDVKARRRGASPSTSISTVAERYQRGLGLRRKTPREKHADLLGPNRDPVAILAAGDRTRVPELVPVRYERMLASPFAFLRGAAAVMAEDLRHQTTAGIPVQACGDCHLMNFGAFATPEDNILFDINDFDETLPGVDTSRSTSRDWQQASPWPRLLRDFQISGRVRQRPQPSKRIGPVSALWPSCHR